MNGKVQVISSILKLDRPFRPPAIIDMTGLDRQLVYYHLKTFCDEGWVQKVGKSYQILDKESLLTSLVEVAENTETALMNYRETVIGKTTVQILNAMAESIVAARNFDEPLSLDAKVAFIRKIDNTVKELKRLRKFLNNSQRGKSWSVKFFKRSDNDLEEWYDAWVKNLIDTPSVTIEEFTKTLKIAMEEADE